MEKCQDGKRQKLNIVAVLVFLVKNLEARLKLIWQRETAFKIDN